MFPLIDYHEIIECITGALEERDSYTEGHSKRVSEMTKIVAQKMGFDDDDCEFLHIAAHLHDIGKIGIPDAILNKKGRLTDEEFRVMKMHSEIGARILQKSKFLSPISDIVLYHHERFDGKGYPKGISSYEIPLGARIIAVCDSIDAMLSTRSYRDSFTKEFCKQEIANCANSRYDPEITKIVLENWESILEVAYDL